jgi:malate synthase
LGTITEEGIRSNINIGILYLESWLRGQGAAAIHHLMEDAATAEISRTQVWQWLHNRVILADGREFTQELYEDFRDEEIVTIRETVGSANYQNGQFVQAICLFNRLIVSPRFEDFLTLSAYNLILSGHHVQLTEDCGREIRPQQFVHTIQEAV